MGVVFRPIVLLPDNGLYFWWLTMDVLELGAVVALLMRAPLVTGLALIPLSLSVAWRCRSVTSTVSFCPASCLRGRCSPAGWTLARPDRGLPRVAEADAGHLCVVAGRDRPAASRRRGHRLRRGPGPGGNGRNRAAHLRQVLRSDCGHLTAPASDLGPPGLARALGMPTLIVAWLPRAVLLVGAALMWRPAGGRGSHGRSAPC